jgi:CheY-like chemotaxis protein
MTVLIVEDNKASARFIEVTLQKQKYQTKVAYDAQMALKILADTPDINLIITDIMMPRINGIALINGIKGKTKYADIPVIMCSSLGNVETVKQAAKAGCTHYLIKPVKKMDLLSKVAEALGPKAT